MPNHDYRELAAVFAGGALGALARAALSALAIPDPARWPWPTFTVNVVGAFLVGYFTTRLLERLPLSSYRRPLLGTGLCGGLTTFSTMQVETISMIEHGHWGLAAAYSVVSITLGLLAVHLATSADTPMTASTALTVAIWIGVMLIGGIGSVLRFLVDRSVARRLARTFPYGTLTVNITGAALLGFLAGLALPKDAALLAGTGFVGAYTTFSTWMLETQRLGEDRQMVSALANIVVSVVLGLAAALLGQWIAQI